MGLNRTLVPSLGNENWEIKLASLVYTKKNIIVGPKRMLVPTLGIKNCWVKLAIEIV